MCIFQATLYFNNKHFQASLSFAVTMMLVMYTLNNSVSSKLPPTSYIKMIDIWLIFGMILPFFITIFLIIIEHIPQKGVTLVKVSAVIHDTVKSKSLVNFVSIFARRYLPFLELLFVLTYVCVALYLY